MKYKFLCFNLKIEPCLLEYGDKKEHFEYNYQLFGTTAMLNY